ncbi:hypothetical protein [Azospirillum sp.]|uniref:hypothetical protein n=1 Tax=Azospirillum sp. TaxID=34012 RepID=UPI003D722AE0
MLFQRATGWLGWTPGVTLRASIFHIEMALDGKVEFVRMTNPWGGDEPSQAAPPKSDDEVAAGLAEFFRSHKNYRGAAEA